MHSSHRRGPVVSDLGVLPSRNGCRWAVQGRSPTPLLPTPPPPWVCWLFSPLRFEQHWLLKLFYFIDQKPLNFSQPKPEPGPNFSACWNGLHSVPSAGSERFLLHRCVCVCVCVVSSDVGEWKMSKYFFIPLLSQLLCGDWSHRALPGAASRLILVVWLGFCWHFVGKVFICAFLILQMLLYLYPDLSVQSLSITDISLIWSWGCRYGRACSECCFVAAMTDLHQCHEQPVTL